MTCRKRAILAFFGLAAGTVLAWSMLPLHLPTMCPFRLVTGLPCPSCGLTHAACALAHGQIRQAERFNFAAVPLALLAAAACIGLVIEFTTNRSCLTPIWLRCHGPLTLLIIALLATAWVFHFVPGPF